MAPTLSQKGVELDLNPGFSDSRMWGLFFFFQDLGSLRALGSPWIEKEGLCQALMCHHFTHSFLPSVIYSSNEHVLHSCFPDVVSGLDIEADSGHKTSVPTGLSRKIVFNCSFRIILPSQLRCLSPGSQSP